MNFYHNISLALIINIFYLILSSPALANSNEEQIKEDALNDIAIRKKELEAELEIVRAQKARLEKLLQEEDSNNIQLEKNNTSSENHFHLPQNLQETDKMIEGFREAKDGQGVLDWAAAILGELEGQSRIAYKNVGLDFDKEKALNENYYKHYVEKGWPPEQAEEMAREATAKEIFNELMKSRQK